jgi:transposase
MSKPITLPPNIFDYNFKLLSQSEPHPRTRIRLLALSHLQNHKSYKQVAEYMQVDITSVKMWLYRFRDGGIEALQEKQRSGRKSKSHGLNEKILTAIKDMQDNKTGGRIRLEDIRQMLKSQFKLNYANPSSVRYLLTQLGLSWITSRSKHPKQDPEAQGLYKKLQKKGNRCPTCGHRLK